MSFRNLLLYTDNWIYNRDINLERVEEIYKSIKDNSMCGWTLHAFEDKNENLEQRQEINNISSTSLTSFFIPVNDILGLESVLRVKSLFSGIKIVQQFY